MNNGDIQDDPVVPEFSRPIAIGKLPASGKRFNEQADLAERAQLAIRFDLPAINQFGVNGMIAPKSRDRFLIEARLTAEIKQTCVVTLDELETTIDTEFRAIFMPAVTGRKQMAADENADDAVIDPFEDEPPSEYHGDTIDIGELAVQHFFDQLDPYPRKSNAAFDPIIEQDPDEAKRAENPFKILRDLKRP